MIEEFSSGYYWTTMHVQEYEHGPVIEQGLYDFINYKLYTEQDVPVMMRVGLDGDELFNVQAEGAIPRDVLALPEEMIDEQGKKNVFVLKSEYADTMGDYCD